MVYGVYRTVGELAHLHRGDYLILLRSAGLHVSARESGVAHWRAVDDPGRSRDRVQSALCASGAAAGAIGRIDSGDCSVPDDPAFPVRLRGGVEIAAMTADAARARSGTSCLT